MPPSRSSPGRVASTCRCGSTSRSCTRRAARPAGSPVVADQFIWPRDADAPGRKIYRCPACDASIGRTGGAGRPGRRGRPCQARDRARADLAGADAAVGCRLPSLPEDLPPAPAALPRTLDPLGVTASDEPTCRSARAAGRPRPRRGPSIRPSVARRAPALRLDRPPRSVPVAAADGVRQSPHYQELRARFPVLDGRDDLVDELLDLYTPRNLYALHAIGAKIDTELRDAAVAAVMRLALATCLLPASRLNGYPGRVASLRISAGHVRQPASRHQREVNVWRAFEAGLPATCAPRSPRSAGPPRGAVRRRLRRARRHGGRQRPLASRPRRGGRAVPAGRRRRPRPVRARRRAERRRAVRSSTSPRAWRARPRGRRDAAAGADLRRRRPRPRAREATALPSRHDASAAGRAQAGRLVHRCCSRAADPDRVLAVAAGRRRRRTSSSSTSSTASRRAPATRMALHLRKPSAEDRLRQRRDASPLRLGAEAGHLTYPGARRGHRTRRHGAPAGPRRAGRPDAGRGRRRGRARPSGLLAPRLAAGARRDEEGEAPRPDRRRRAAAARHASSARSCGATTTRRLVRIGDEARPLWWLREPGAGGAPARRPRRVGDLVDPVHRRPDRRGRLLRSHLSASSPGSRRPTRSWCARAWRRTSLRASAARSRTEDDARPPRRTTTPG